MAYSAVRSRNEVYSHKNSLALQVKCEREASKLQSILANQLRSDLQSLYDNKLFDDLTLVCNDGQQLKVHSSILRVRTKLFYHSIVSTDSEHLPDIVKLPNVSFLEAQDFIRAIYCDDHVVAKEQEFLAKLRKNRKVDDFSTVNSSTNYGDTNFNLEQSVRSKPNSLTVMEEQLKSNVIEEAEMSIERHDSDECFSHTESATDNYSSTLADVTDPFSLSNVDSIVLTTATDVRNKETGIVDEPSVDNPLNYTETNNKTVDDKDYASSDLGCEDVSELLDDELTKSTRPCDLVNKPSQLVVGQSDVENCICLTEDEVEKDSDNTAMVLLQVDNNGCEENCPRSSSDSLPKDDSLEFCPDSLASEEAILEPTVETTDYNNLVYEKQMSHYTSSELVPDETCAKISTVYVASTSATTTTRKHAWSEVKNTPAIAKTSVFEVRCWNISGDQQTRINKPSAVVTPYNAQVDSTGFLEGSTTTISEQTVAAAAATADIADAVQFDEGPRRHEALERNCRVQFELVPFLQEFGVVDGRVNPAGHVASPVVENRIPTRLRSSSVDQSLSNKVYMKRSVVDDDARPILSGFAFHEPKSTMTEEAPPSEEATSTPPPPPPQKKTESFFVFLDTSSAPGEVSSEQCTEIENPELCSSAVVSRSKEDRFFFIPTGEPCPEADPDLRETSCWQVDDGRRDASDNLTPPPVYMYIENKPSASQRETVPSVVQRRSADHSLVQRRLRPKSESAATLFKDGDKAVMSEKRNSLLLPDDKCHDDVVPDDVMSKTVEQPVNDVETGSDDTSISSYAPCSKLGEDLLRMFLDEVNPDVTIRVNGRDIRAHKSILTSRCVYFAAMLSGGWVESSGNVIKLQGFSYKAVHFALCYIYSGASSVPSTIDISELASLADMLGLEGLKEVVTLSLKMKYCHFFHKPCSTCVTGVSECLLIATSFGLEELQEKCLKWITKYMLRTWPTKAFAALPDEVQQKCLMAAVVEITVDTVLDVLTRCDKLLGTLPRVKWTEPIFFLGTKLSAACSKFLSQNFASILTSNAFLALRSGQTWNIRALEISFLPAVEHLPLDIACQAYVRLHALLQMPDNGELMQCADYNENFETLLSKIHREVEHLLIHNANRVVRCTGWSLLSADLQKRIKDAAVIVFDFGKPKTAPPKLSSLNRKFQRQRASNSVSSDSAVPLSRVASALAANRPKSTAMSPQPRNKMDRDPFAKPKVKAAILSNGEKLSSAAVDKRLPPPPANDKKIKNVSEDKNRTSVMLEQRKTRVASASAAVAPVGTEHPPLQQKTTQSSACRVTSAATSKRLVDVSLNKPEASPARPKSLPQKQLTSSTKASPDLANGESKLTRILKPSSKDCQRGSKEIITETFAATKTMKSKAVSSGSARGSNASGELKMCVKNGTKDRMCRTVAAATAASSASRALNYNVVVVRESRASTLRKAMLSDNHGKEKSDGNVKGNNNNNKTKPDDSKSSARKRTQKTNNLNIPSCSNSSIKV